MKYKTHIYGKLSEKLIVENGNTSIVRATSIMRLITRVSMNPNISDKVSETYEQSSTKKLRSIASGTNGTTRTFARSA